MSHLLNHDYTFNINAVLEDMKLVLSEYNEIEWYSKLTWNTAIRGQGHNKLRTYRLFKKELKIECYIKDILNHKHRSALAKFRCGVAPIWLETGRYECLDINQRICPICNYEVETEEHVLTRCPAYIDYRNDLYTASNNVNDDFNTLNDCDKMCFILNEPKPVTISYTLEDF